MSSRLAWALAIAAVLLGSIHLLIGAISFDGLTFQALWFVGAGVAIVTGGLANLLALLSVSTGAGRAVLGLANLSLTAFFALALVILPQPQVFVGLGIFAGLTALGLLRNPAGARSAAS